MSDNIERQLIESREIKEFFTGSFGLVINPDQSTTEKAKQLARSLAPKAEFLVDNPHITLYHAEFKNLPREKIKKIIMAMENLPEQSLKLKNLQIFGDKFLFWNVIKTDQLQQAHEQTLQLARYLNQEAPARDFEEELTLTEQELKNIKKFGHPLTRDLYLPHITLAYDPNGIKLAAGQIAEEHQMRISNVNFAEIGQYGTIKNIIKL